MWLSKKAEFDADFESVEKVAKNSREKNYQQNSDRKIEFLVFSIVCTNFLFSLALFANLKTKSVETARRNRKTLLLNVPMN